MFTADLLTEKDALNTITTTFQELTVAANSKVTMPIDTRKNYKPTLLKALKNLSYRLTLYR